MMMMMKNADALPPTGDPSFVPTDLNGCNS
jgi:hypothetical protein